MPTNEEVEAVIKMATSTRPTPDGRPPPGKDTRTQLYAGNVRFVFFRFSSCPFIPLPFCFTFAFAFLHNNPISDTLIYSLTNVSNTNAQTDLINELSGTIAELNRLLGQLQGLLEQYISFIRTNDINVVVENGLLSIEVGPDVEEDQYNL